MPNVSISLEFAWQIAASEAIRSRHEFIEPEHLFIGLCGLEKVLSSEMYRQLQLSGDAEAELRTEWEALAALFVQFNINPSELRQELRQRRSNGSFERKENVIHRSPTSKAIFDRAAELAEGSPVVTTLHVLVALLDNTENPVVALLKEKGVDAEALKTSALDPEHMPSFPQILTPLLTRFGRDLIQLAREEKIHECIGRRDEMLRIIQTLSRETKNNPVLIGDAGVGKTAIVEGLAWRIAKGKSLPGKSIIQLHVADLVAGTKHRGEFEERVQGILREVTQSPNILLFIDEIHTLIGAGGSGDILDAANMMKPALARGELRCIGATTVNEYRKYFEKDPSLERRFQPIMINEPLQGEVLEILTQGYKERFETKHLVKIDPAAIQATVTLSTRYLSDRRLPDKAIDLLDETCSRIANPMLTVRPGQPMGGIVTAEAIATTLSAWTKIPVTQLTTDERTRLLAMAEELKARVIGQDEACETVAQAVQRVRAGLKPGGRPIAVLLFLGPTGVGKTELAKATAVFLFGSEKALIRLDMSEFMEKHAISRLIGAPPGYVGHEEEGQLTGALRRTPFCVVLLDEIEKAHPDVLNLFLQLFDDGRLTDSKGRTVDASNVLFIATSNVKYESKVGFRSKNSGAQSEAFILEVRKSFRPEFVNRLDEIIVFHPLNREHIKRIAQLILKDLENRLMTQEVGLEVKDAALEWLCKQGYDEVYGVRPLRRVIEQQIENPIAWKILREEVKPGHSVVADSKDGALLFDVRAGTIF
jgi:ATP-dependent Clp protease ATP-binding subunit ClpC